MEHKIIFDGVFGSHLYGTNTPESDKDYKAIYLPTAHEIIMMKGKTHFSQNTNDHSTKNGANDVDREFYSLAYFIELASKGETIALDMIHTPESLNGAGKNSVWDFIRQNRHRFYTTDMKAYLGYVRKQAGKYGVKGTRLAALRLVKEHVDKLDTERRKTPEELESEIELMAKNGKFGHVNAKVDLRIRDHIESFPMLPGFTSIYNDQKGNRFYEILGRKYQDTMSIDELKHKINGVWDEYGHRARMAEKNEGIDWKALHHATRGGMQLKEIFETGDLQYPLAERKLLVEIKSGKLPFSEVQEILEQLMVDVDLACTKHEVNGTLPKSVDVEFWNNFIYETHKNIVLKEM